MKTTHGGRELLQRGIKARQMPLRLGVLLMLLVATGAFADQGKILRHQKPVSGRYIVVFKETAVDAPNVVAMAHEMLTRYGGNISHNPQGEEIFAAALRGFVINIPEAAAVILANDPRVKFVEQDAYVEGSATRSLPESGYPTFDYRRWNLDRLDELSSAFDPALAATDPVVYRGSRSYTFGADGSGVFIYLMDTGVERSHQEFIGGRVQDGARFSSDTANTAYSTCGGTPTFESQTNATHGQGTASVAAGNTVGVASGAYIVPLKVMSCDNQGTSLLSWWVAAMNWMLSSNPYRYRPATYPLVQAPAVVSISMFYDAALFPSAWADASIDSFETAVTNVIANGIAVVASANNQGPDYQYGQPYQTTYQYGRSCYQSPARLAYHARDGACDASGCSGNYFVGNPSYRVISVGGTDEYDRIWDCRDWGECAFAAGSNTGRCVDIYAPAHAVKVANLESSSSYRQTTNHLNSGTSFSAPYVAGVAARLLQANPGLTPAQLWQRIHDLAQPLPTDFDHDSVPDNDKLAHLDPSY